LSVSLETAVLSEWKGLVLITGIISVVNKWEDLVSIYAQSWSQ